MAKKSREEKKAKPEEKAVEVEEGLTEISPEADQLSAGKKAPTDKEVVQESFFNTPIEEEKPKKRLGFFKKLSPKQKGILLALVLLVSAGLFIAGYMQYKAKQPAEKQQGISAEEAQSLVAKVGKHIDLPEETPDIATVTDKSSLPQDDFFSKAQNGDKVLVLKSIKRVILYRPSTDKIIDVGIYNAPQVAADASPTPEESKEPIKIVILNGTQEAGLAKKASDLIESEAVEVVATGNALGEYQTTSISSVGISNNISESRLKAVIKGVTKVTVGVKDYPDEENEQSKVDAVLILGDDFAEEY